MARKPNKRPAKPKKAGTKPALNDDDAALFDAAMRDVDKFDGKDAGSPPVAPDVPAAPNRAAPRKRPPPGRQESSVKSLPALSPGASADVDARTLDRLKRGQLRPEARLDLHGMTQDKAHGALNRFMAQAQSAGTRCVIVITGKGRVSEGGGVLRNQVPNWLNAPAIRPRILAFAPAQPRDGGSGALYVLLRRAR